eukprot:Em0001g102a
MTVITTLTLNTTKAMGGKGSDLTTTVMATMEMWKTSRMGCIRSEAGVLLKRLDDVGQVDPQVVLVLLRLCGSYLIKMFKNVSLLAQSLETFNSSVHQSDNIQIGSVLEKLPSQKTLSSILDDNLFRVLQGYLSIADRARLLSASSPHASSWLMVIPSEGQGLHLDPPVFQTALKWWLGLDTAEGSVCALCPDKMLDPLGHHATTCKRGGDVIFRHNRLRDILAETCRRAHFSVEAGCNLTPDHSHSRPADVLISNWAMGKTAACDVSVTSPLNSNIMSEAGVTAGAAAQATELRKHEANDVKCSEGKEAMESFSSLASRLAITSSRPKSAVLSELYGRLNLNLVRANLLTLWVIGRVLSALCFVSCNTCGITSVMQSGRSFGSASNRHLLSAISKFNALVFPTEAITLESVLSSPLSQHALCKKEWFWLNALIYNNYHKCEEEKSQHEALAQAGPLVEHRIVNLNGPLDATIMGESHNTKTPREGFRGEKLSIHQGLPV